MPDFRRIKKRCLIHDDVMIFAPAHSLRRAVRKRPSLEHAACKKFEPPHILSCIADQRICQSVDFTPYLVAHAESRREISGAFTVEQPVADGVDGNRRLSETPSTGKHFEPCWRVDNLLLCWMQVWEHDVLQV